jgi:outer membrane lipoprotein SlyB
MKHTLKSYASNIVLASLVVGLFAGCAATRPIADTALGAGGAYLGNKLSNGDPLATAAGAAGGVILSEGLHFAAKKQSDNAYAAGYDKGKSDAVKQQYWLYIAMQKQRNQVANVRLYPVKLPEQRIDGVTFQPSTKFLRIEE